MLVNSSGKIVEYFRAFLDFLCCILSQRRLQDVSFLDLFQPLLELFNLLFVFFHFGEDAVLPADLKFYLLEKVITFLDKLPVLFVPRINKCLNNAFLLALDENISSKKQGGYLVAFNLFDEFFEHVDAIG